MIKTNVPNYFAVRPGVIICRDEESKKRADKERLMFDKEQATNERINSLMDEIIQLKQLVSQIITKE